MQGVKWDLRWAFGRVHTYVNQRLNWSRVCMSTSISAGRLHAHTQYTPSTVTRNPSWNIPVTSPIELLTGVSLLNHSCWDFKPISRTSLQASDSSARYPVVPLLCWPSDGRIGNKNREAENAARRFQGIKSRLLRTKSDVCCWFESKECASGSLCGCVHCTATTKQF